MAAAGAGAAAGAATAAVTATATATTPSDLVENVVAINRVAKVVKGGRRFSFNALVAVGDGKGRVGIATGKANEVSEAVRKAVEAAKRVDGRAARAPARRSRTRSSASTARAGCCSSRPRPVPASSPAAPVRAVLECAGITDILTKSLGSTNPHNMVRATMDGLSQLVTRAAGRARARRRASTRSRYKPRQEG